MARVNINVELLQKGMADYYEVQPNALVYVKQWKAAAKEATTTNTSKGGTATPTTTLKVFTGVVSQGKLGADVSFISRQDDLIVNSEELRQAALNNLAPWLTALPGRIAYEVKIVPSIITKDGFRQYGQAQTVTTGYYKDGRPKTKTVVNRFATMKLYFIKSGGERQKLDDIVLGPTDAVSFRPTNEEIAQLENNLKQDIVLTDINQVTGIVAAGTEQAGSGTVGIAVSGGVAGQLQQAAPMVSVPAAFGSETEILRVFNSNIPGTEPGSTDYNKALIWNALVTAAKEYEPSAKPEINRNNWMNILYLALGGNAVQQDLYRNSPLVVSTLDKLMRGYTREATAEESAAGAASTPQTAGPTATNALAPSPMGTGDPACRAGTLSEFYAVLGQSLPSVQQRSTEYSKLGLGPAAWYTGTAEQNNKLLRELKKQRGCAV